MSVEELGFADRAIQPTVGAHKHIFLENNLSPAVEARLTDVMQRLRAAWIAGPALIWSDIHPINEMPLREFEKRVATTLRQGFFEFSQFLSGFEVLLLQAHQLRVVREEAVLGLEQLLVDLTHRNGDLVEISKANRRLAELLCSCDCCRSDGNKTVVHE